MEDLCVDGSTGESDVIRKLDPSVIAKIAAGEVVVRPSGVLKETIENSIDAGAQTIKIRLSANPLEYGEISDDGCGISPNDMLMVCRRYTTSKTHKDINGIKSFGFRGEALAALSHAANVTISSRTSRQDKRTIMRYKEGEPIMETAGRALGPVGFTISYENLFFNMATRGRAISASPNTEFSLCLELVQKYSIHFHHIDFVFQKLGSSTHELTTCNDEKLRGEKYQDHDYKHFKEVSMFPPDAVDTDELVNYRETVESNAKAQLSRVKNSIKNIYGTAVASTLHEFHCHSTSNVYYSCKGFFTHPNQPNRQHAFILFINNRLIDHPTLRRNIDHVYKDLLHKRQRRFVYLSIYMPYERIDANVHPSKERIVFQYQQEIIDEISTKLRGQIQHLMGLNSDGFKNPIAYSKLDIATKKSEIEEPIVPHLKRTYQETEKPRVYQKYRIRSDYRQKDISNYYIPSYIVESNANFESFSLSNALKNEELPEEDVADQPEVKGNLKRGHKGIIGNLDINLMEFTGNSNRFQRLWGIPFIKELLEGFQASRDAQITEILLNSVLVGVADKNYILLQHDTALYMVDIIAIVKECAFQSIIWRIGQLPKLNLKPGLCLIDLISYDLAREHSQQHGGEIYKSNFRKQAEGLIERFKVYLLTQYFSFTIEDSMLYSIPKVMSNYFPGVEYLPGLMRTIFSLQIKQEGKGVKDIAYVLSEYYTYPPLHSITTMDPATNERNYEHYLSQVLLKSVQRFPDLSLNKTKLKKGVIIKLASLEQLYRIFERC